MTRPPKRTKPTKKWALFNYNTLFHVADTRRDCIAYGHEIVIGGAERFEQQRLDGAWRTARVLITELPKPKRRRK